MKIYQGRMGVYPDNKVMEWIGKRSFSSTRLVIDSVDPISPPIRRIILL